MDKIRISIIIPYFRSGPALQKNLPYLLENLRNMSWAFELIVVDDGSGENDPLGEILKPYPAQLIRMDKNKGKGEALRIGFAASKGEVQIFTDPDIPFEFEAIIKMVALIENGEADLVIGNRLLKESVYYDRVSLVRKWGSRAASFFLGHIITGGYYDTQCGIKAFSREASQKIFEWSSVHRFAIDVEIIYLALKFKYSIVRIPVRLRSTDGKTVRVFRDGLIFIRDMFRVKFNYEKKRREERRSSKKN